MSLRILFSRWDVSQILSGLDTFVCIIPILTENVRKQTKQWGFYSAISVIRNRYTFDNKAKKQKIVIPLTRLIIFFQFYNKEITPNFPFCTYSIFFHLFRIMFFFFTKLIFWPIVFVWFSVKQKKLFFLLAYKQEENFNEVSIYKWTSIKYKCWILISRFRCKNERSSIKATCN